MFYKSVDCWTPVYSILDQLAVKMQDIRFNNTVSFSTVVVTSMIVFLQHKDLIEYKYSNH